MKYLYIVFALVLFAGCAQTQTMPMDHDMHGGHHMMDVDSEEAFVVEMIPHHQEAVDTSRIIVENSDNAELVDLAQRIIVAQQEEIDMMQGWLTQYYDGGYEANYQEMMGDLSSLEGDELDVAYIQGMIMHHRMAVMMARQVLALEPSDHVEEFALDVVSVQTAEINELQGLLEQY